MAQQHPTPASPEDMEQEFSSSDSEMLEEQPLQMEHSSAASPENLNTMTAPKKPVNAFMTFRTYYSGVFKECQQKDRSSFVTMLWQYEPNKNTWVVISQVFSAVRDEAFKIGKKLRMAPFLAVACPAIGIVAPTEYLSVYGWILTYDDNSMTLSKNPTHAITQLPPRGVSRIDLLNIVISGGFVLQGIDLTHLRDKMMQNPENLMTVQAFNTAVTVRMIAENPLGFAAALLGVPIADDALGRGLNVTYTADINGTGHHAHMLTHAQGTYYGPSGQYPHWPEMEVLEQDFQMNMGALDNADIDHILDINSLHFPTATHPLLGPLDALLYQEHADFDALLAATLSSTQ